MTAPRGGVALVLHAHLPYVRSNGGDEDIEERWLYEALWESYLPLLAVLERAADEIRPERPLLTLSISPTLLSMLADPRCRGGFTRYGERLVETAQAARAALPALGPAIDDHLARWEASAARLRAARGDVPRAVADLAKRGAVEIITTAATHAFLPLLLSPSSIRAQLRLGPRYLRTVTGLSSRGLWLPECGYDERFGADLAASGAAFTVLEAHGVSLARPRPPAGAPSPIVSPGGVAFFPRDVGLVGRVWSRERGYPGDPVYREFYRDVADVLPEAELLRAGFGPTGIRPLRVTGSDAKEPYEPRTAAARAREHARDFAARALDALGRSDAPSPIVVLAFDAELFGHWWWEGPAFLAELLRALGGAATSLGGYLDRDPELPVAEPATSSWGEGGFSEVWTHPSSAHVTRMVHRAEKRVLHVDALVRDTPRAPVQREARLWAIRELLQLQASDYPFMLRVGQAGDFAERRLREHARHVELLTEIASRDAPEPDDAAIVRAISERRPLFRELDEDALADAFDPFE